MREPLPLACMTSAAYAAAALAGADADKAGRKAWESGWKLPQGGRRPRAPARARRHPQLRRADRRAAAPRRAGRRLGRHRDDALRPLRPPPVGRPPAHTRRSSSGEPPPPTSSRSTSAARCRPGVTVLEASAGTGKTFTIAALAARYVAEGTPLEQLLLVTFTRMATGELRERVRERLVSAEQGLDRALAGAPPTGRGRRAAREGHAATRSSSGASASPARSPTSTPPRSPPPTASARRCSAAWASRATSTPTPPSSRTSATCSRRSSTTSTCGACTAATSRSSTARRRCGSRGSRSTTPRCASSPSTRRRTPSRRCAAAWRSPCATSSSAASARWRS